MFKSARWRGEKNKIKGVFKLQFHATQLRQLGADALIILVIPADIGKPTTRLEKSKVKDESCYWEKPHYETVKFTHDPKTGKFNEKIYHFVLATGSSKSSGIGEVSIDFASFVEATKLSSLSLPLKNENSNAILHVSVQRVSEPLEQSEVHTNGNASRQDRSLRAQLSNGDIQENVPSNPTEDCGTLSDKIHINRRVSSGSDITLTGSNSSYEPEPKNPNPTPTHELSTQTIYEDRVQQASQWDWLAGSPPDSTTDDSSLSSGEPLLEDGSPGTEIKKLKSQLEVLTRQADVSELELQTLRKQIVKERKKGLDLSKEVAKLLEERKASEEVKVNDVERCNPRVLVDELRQELNHEKELNSNLRLQLQKTQESNAELILAVKDLEEMIEKSELSRKDLKPETDDDDEDQKALEEIVREHSGVQEAYLLEQKITNLNDEIEWYKKDKSELETQNDQIAHDYETIKQENHKLETLIVNLEKDLENQARWFESYKKAKTKLEMQNDQIALDCETLKQENHELKTRIANLEKDLEYQDRGFESYKRAKTELEKQNDQIALDYETLQQENHELQTRIASLEKDLENQARGFESCKKDKTDLETQNDQITLAYETLKQENLELESRIANLVEALENQARGFESHKKDKTELETQNDQIALAYKTLKQENHELKTRIANLEKDIETQVRGFESDLDDIMKVKLEMEQRAVQAEETLRNAKTKNAKTAERIQNGFRKLATQVTSSFEANESLTNKLRLEKHDLEVTIQQFKQDLDYLNDRYKEKLVDLSCQISLKSEKLTKMEKQIEDLSSEFEWRKMSYKSEIEKVENKICLAKSELERSRKELTELTCVNEQKDVELDRVKSLYGEIKVLLMEDESEKEKLRKEISRLRGEMKKLNDNNQARFKNDAHSSKEVVSLKKRIEQLEGEVNLKEATLKSSKALFLEKENDQKHKIHDLERRLEVLDQNNAILQTSRDEEMAIMKNLKKSMEVELLEMQERYSEISLKFAEVEGERQKLVMTLRNVKNSKKR